MMNMKFTVTQTAAAMGIEDSQLNAILTANGILPALGRLHAAQDADPDCEKFVRNKLRDDISVVYAEI